MAIVIKSTRDHECTCGHCGARIGYTDEDTYVASIGKGLECPNCAEFIVLDDSIKQGQFPEAFYKFRAEDGAVHIPDERIQQWVNECVVRMRSHPDCDVTYISSGDSLVMAVWDDTDIIVWVCRGYYEAFVEGAK